MLYNSPSLPCQGDVLYRLEDGGAAIVFRTASTLFILTGRGDRQPNLENLYQRINSVAVVQNDEVQFRENDFEGECHIHLRADAKQFYSLKCDVFNRKRGQFFGLQLTKIHSFHRH